MNAALSRRAAFGALAVMPVAIAAPALAALPTPFRLKVMACDRAHHEEELFEATVHGPARTRWRAAIDAMEVPVARWTDAAGIAVERRADDYRAVDRARHNLAAIGDAPRGRSGEGWQRLVDAADAMQAERCRLADVTGYSASTKRMDALTDASWQAIDAVVNHPVDNADDLAAKVRIISKHRQFDLESVQQQLAADIERIAGAGGFKA